MTGHEVTVKHQPTTAGSVICGMVQVAMLLHPVSTVDLEKS